jgi:flotillin
LEAQATGEAAIIQKRAEALGTLVKNAGGANEAFKLLMVEQIPVVANAAAAAIANIKFDKITVWESGGGDGSGGMLPTLFRAAKDI